MYVYVLVLGIIIALVFGKAIGIFGATYLVTRLTKATLSPAMRWGDVIAIGLLSGIGFTVSLLIVELSYEDSPGLMANAKMGVIAASLVASLLAIAALQYRAFQIRQRD